MDHTTTAALLADIGGTNARFALWTERGVGPVTTLAVADHASPVAAARAFLASTGGGRRAVRAAIAAAGPVQAQRVAMTNAAWAVDGPQLREALDLESVVIVNDFEALGWAIPGLGPQDLRPIGGGAVGQPGPAAIMGPGTGFGLAAWIGLDAGETVLVTEGGHATLPAENRRDEALIGVLRDRGGHVSVERVLSGPGMAQLYQAVAAVDGFDAPERDAAGIVSHALARDCEASLRTLEAFCGFLGAVAGNVALTLGARGGVAIAGGMAKRFADFLAASSFRERFEAKGRLAGYLAQIPTAVVIHPDPAFIGLARLASGTARRA
ncbi:Glucokinase [Rhodovastum atsumiense]|uniref:Glucokinase n=1 Tax=Rhodovastum atsumiense TaxID=504468 RepID=A0A5M6IXG8_9PROT|nr:glucokinase [Rhodovastum atsumiense]KAA5613023.1 glucokinase [Rhodovastum atsumiense]CAH2600126.1 Glucokinase [Rhodovastum atsumiense]